MTDGKYKMITQRGHRLADGKYSSMANYQQTEGNLKSALNLYKNYRNEQALIQREKFLYKLRQSKAGYVAIDARTGIGFNTGIEEAKAVFKEVFES
jgi:cystathionine beta-lyase family protein involved in aluminum resistance